MSNKQLIYNVGMYLRLSKEDGDGESESITNQRKIIREYIDKHYNMNLYDEYIDDGYSGANFNRPNFRRMISDVENKKINMIITKNLARLGRDYIETGYYIEKFFPDYNVRYIAILDDVDNFVDSISNDFMPIKSVINEKHCKDTSIAVKKSKRRKMKDGFYACTTPPFGYKKDPENQGKLIIDEVSSQTVKKIFELKENGYTINQIVDYLEENNYMTPAEYMKIRGLENVENKDIWKASSVKRILCNKVYLGYCLRGKTQKISYKSNNRIYVKRSDYICIKDSHEPIIDEETFANVHNNRKYGLIGNTKDNVYLLKDLIYCGECGKKLIFKKRSNDVEVYCRQNAENNKLCSNICKIKYSNLENKTFFYLEEMYKMYLNSSEAKDKLYKDIIIDRIKNIESNKKQLEREISSISFKISSLYNKRLSEEIDEKNYKEQYEELSNYRKKLQCEMNNIEEKLR